MAKTILTMKYVGDVPNNATPQPQKMYPDYNGHVVFKPVLSPIVENGAKYTFIGWREEGKEINPAAGLFLDIGLEKVIEGVWEKETGGDYSDVVSTLGFASVERNPTSWGLAGSDNDLNAYKKYLGSENGGSSLLGVDDSLKKQIGINQNDALEKQGIGSQNDRLKKQILEPERPVQPVEPPVTETPGIPIKPVEPLEPKGLTMDDLVEFGIVEPKPRLAFVETVIGILEVGLPIVKGIIDKNKSSDSDRPWDRMSMEQKRDLCIRVFNDYVSQVEAKYPTKNAGYYTEMSKTINYYIALYRAMLSDSSNSGTIEAYGQFGSYLQTQLRQFVSSVPSNYRKEVVREDFNPLVSSYPVWLKTSFAPQERAILSMGSYSKFTAPAKKSVIDSIFGGGDNNGSSAGNGNVTPNNGGSSNGGNNNVFMFVIMGLGVVIAYLLGKKKK